MIQSLRPGVVATRIVWRLAGVGILGWYFWQQRRPRSRPSPRRSAYEIYASMRGRYEQSLAFVQADLAAQSDEDGDDPELARLMRQDDEECLQVEVALLDRLMQEPALQTRSGVEELLRTLAIQLDATEAEMIALPDFDEMIPALTETERQQEERHKALDSERLQVVWQLALLIQFVGISDRRLYEIQHIIGAYHERAYLLGNVESDASARRVADQEQAAACYPMIQAWLQGKHGSLATLPIPGDLAAWHPHTSIDPSLVIPL